MALVPTRYDIGQQVFIIHKNRVLPCYVIYAKISLGVQVNPHIEYSLSKSCIGPAETELCGIIESLIYPSKEELLKSL